MPLRCAWAAHPSHCLCAGETLPMWKPTTGEPYAGEPHVRFGGRGGATPLPDPYRNYLSAGFPDRLFRGGDEFACPQDFLTASFAGTTNPLATWISSKGRERWVLRSSSRESGRAGYRLRQHALPRASATFHRRD